MPNFYNVYIVSKNTILIFTFWGYWQFNLYILIAANLIIDILNLIIDILNLIILLTY